MGWDSDENARKIHSQKDEMQHLLSVGMAQMWAGEIQDVFPDWETGPWDGIVRQHQQ